MNRAVAVARTNIALVKYWGKRDGALNLPAVGSLSLTLDGLQARTEVIWDDAPADRFVFNGQEAAGGPLDRVSKFLDLVRALQDGLGHARVDSSCNFPASAGLASSAAGFAALAVAATWAAGLRLDKTKLSELARRGSGSAARSIFGGFVLMHRGELGDGSDAVAEPLADGAKLDVRMVVGVCGEGPKSTLSTDGMRHTAATSPYFPLWVETHPADLKEALQALATQDLARLGEVTERSCLKMHASAMAASPGVLYWSGATVEGFHTIRALRREGVEAWFTNDAGPHVKALCRPRDAARVAEALGRINGVTRVIISAPGAAAEVVEQ